MGFLLQQQANRTAGAIAGKVSRTGATEPTRQKQTQAPVEEKTLQGEQGAGEAEEDVGRGLCIFRKHVKKRTRLQRWQVEALLASERT